MGGGPICFFHYHTTYSNLYELLFFGCLAILKQFNYAFNYLYYQSSVQRLTATQLLGWEQNTDPPLPGEGVEVIIVADAWSIAGGGVCVGSGTGQTVVAGAGLKEHCQLPFASLTQLC